MMSTTGSIDWVEQEKQLNEQLSRSRDPGTFLQVLLEKQDLLDTFILRKWESCSEEHGKWVINQLLKSKPLATHFGLFAPRALCASWLKTHLLSHAHLGDKDKYGQVFHHLFSWSLSTEVKQELEEGYSHPGWKNWIQLNALYQEQGLSKMVEFMLSRCPSSMNVQESGAGHTSAHQRIKEWLYLTSENRNEVETEWVKQTAFKAWTGEHTVQSQMWLWYHWSSVKNRSLLPSAWPWSHEETDWESLKTKSTSIFYGRLSQRMLVQLGEFEKEVSAVQIQKQLREQLPQSSISRMKKTI